MAREVVIESGDPEVREEGVSAKSDKDSQGGSVLRDGGVSDVRSRPRSVNKGRKKPRPDVHEGREDPKVPAVAEEPPKDFRLGVDWLSVPVEYAEKVVGILISELDLARNILKERIAAGAKINLRCSNPKCLRPLASEKSCVSIFQIRDPKTWIERTIYSCSQQCHAVNHHLAKDEKVIRT